MQLFYHPFHSNVTQIRSSESNSQPDSSHDDLFPITRENKQSNHNDPADSYDIIWTCTLLVGASLVSAAITRYVVSLCEPRDELDDNDNDMIMSLPATSVTPPSVYQTKSPEWMFRVNSFLAGLILLMRVLAAVIFVWLASWAF